MTTTQCLCGRPHATTKELAACLWPDAQRVVGTGEYAVVATFPGGRAVTLWTWPDDALDTKLNLDTAAAADDFPASSRIHRLQLGAGVSA